jgi:hypothetical protein
MQKIPMFDLTPLVATIFSAHGSYFVAKTGW